MHLSHFLLAVNLCQCLAFASGASIDFENRLTLRDVDRESLVNYLHARGAEAVGKDLRLNLRSRDVKAKNTAARPDIYARDARHTKAPNLSPRAQPGLSKGQFNGDVNSIAKGYMEAQKKMFETQMRMTNAMQQQTTARVRAKNE